MTSGARRVIFGIKLSEDEAAACDTARGDMPRSEWGRALLLAGAVAGADVPPVNQPWSRLDAKPLEDIREIEREDRRRTSQPFAEPTRTEPPAPTRTRPPVAASSRQQCPHPKGRRQKNGTYCPACGTGGLTSG